MSEILEHQKIHKELHDKIYNCKNKCKPYLRDEDYCCDCKNEVLSFMYKYGAGVLTNDILIEYQTKAIRKLEKIATSLKKKLEEKNKKYETLKEKCVNSQEVKK